METSRGFSVSRRSISRCTSGNFDFCAATMIRLETLSGQIRTCGLPPGGCGEPPADGGGEADSGLAPEICGLPPEKENRCAQQSKRIWPEMKEGPIAHSR